MIRFVYITLLLLLTKEALSSLEDQNQENLDPTSQDPEFQYPKEQSKRTIFGHPGKGWAKHVGYHPSGLKYVLGYGPVDHKYMTVVKPIQLKPVKMHFHGWKPLGKIRPHFRQVVPFVRPVMPFRPSVPFHMHKDNGWKPVVPLPPNVPPPQQNLRPWQTQGWDLEKPVNAGIPIGTVLPGETKPVVTVETKPVAPQPVVPVKPIVPAAPVLPPVATNVVTHLHPIAPFPIHHVRPIFPSVAVPVAQHIPVAPAPPPVLPPAPIPFPAQPHGVIIPQPHVHVAKPALPVLPLGASFPSPVLPPGVIKAHHYPVQAFAPAPQPIQPVAPAPPVFHHVQPALESAPPLVHTPYQPLHPGVPVTHLNPVLPAPPALAPAPPQPHFIPRPAPPPQAIPTGAGTIEFHGKAAHLIPVRHLTTLQGPGVVSLPAPGVGALPGPIPGPAVSGHPVISIPGPAFVSQPGHTLVPQAVPSHIPGHHLTPFPGPAVAPSPAHPLLPGPAISPFPAPLPESPLPGVPVNAQIPAFDLATFFRKHPGVTPFFPSGQIPINLNPEAPSNAHGPPQTPVHHVFPSNFLPPNFGTVQNGQDAGRQPVFPHFIQGTNVDGDGVPQEQQSPINHHVFPQFGDGGHVVSDGDQEGLHPANLPIQPGQTDLQIPFHLPQHPNFRPHGGNHHQGSLDFDVQTQQGADGSFHNLDTNFRPSPNDQFLQDGYVKK